MLVFVPKNCTDVLQPIGLSVNKPDQLERTAGVATSFAHALIKLAPHSLIKRT